MAVDEPLVRSAWLKWARAVEHQRVLARAGREFVSDGDANYEYVLTDNSQDNSDPLIRMHWRLKIQRPFPDRWSVLVGDVLANLRDALDHVMWAAVTNYSGVPQRPQDISFPITSTSAEFGKRAKKLQSLVSPSVWEVVESEQPFHGGAQAHTAPLAVLRWLSNVDKHRAVHFISSTFFDADAPLLATSIPLNVVYESRYEGQTQDGQVVAVLKLQRPEGPLSFDLTPTFFYRVTLQISDNPVEVRTLDSAMDVMRENVAGILGLITERLGDQLPKPEDLGLGEEHEGYAAEFAGDLYQFTDKHGETHRAVVARSGIADTRDAGVEHD